MNISPLGHTNPRDLKFLQYLLPVRDTCDKSASQRSLAISCPVYAIETDEVTMGSIVSSSYLCPADSSPYVPSDSLDREVRIVGLSYAVSDNLRRDIS